jgi:hypothetical protein
MTCPPDAFRSAVALIRLEPGRPFTTNRGIRPGELDDESP